MNNYYVVSIQKTENSNPISITGYESRDDAMSAYHSTLASNYLSDVLVSFAVLLLNEHGGTEAREFWAAPIPEELPEELPDGE